MGKLLWKPSANQVAQANATQFINFVNKKYDFKINSYFQLFEWSVEKIPDFWAALWEFGEVIASRRYDKVIEDLNAFPGTKWFPGARLNYAENLLRN